MSGRMQYWICFCVCVGVTCHMATQVSTNKTAHHIREPVSIIDSKIPAIPSKSHLPYLPFKGFCSLINSRVTNETGGLLACSGDWELN